MTVNISHQLSQEEATTRIKKMLEGVKAQFGGMITHLDEKWEGNTGNFNLSMSGHSATGTIQVQPTAVQVDINLPFIANMFKGKIKSIIEDQGAKALS